MTQVRGLRITPEYEGRKITRNSSFFKKLSEHVKRTTEDSGDISLANQRNEETQQQQQVVRRSNRERRPTDRYGDRIDSGVII